MQKEEWEYGKKILGECGLPRGQSALGGGLLGEFAGQVEMLAAGSRGLALEES